MAKKKVTTINLHVRAIAVVFFAAFVFSAWLYLRLEIRNPKPQENVEEKKVQQNISNGVYENYTYNFKFSYPEEVFTYPFYSNMNLFASIFENGDEIDDYNVLDNGMHIYVGVSSSEYSLSRYESDKDRQIGELFYPEESYKSKPLGDWPGSNDRRIENLNGDGYEGYIDYSLMTGGGGGQEPSYGYSATIRKDNLIIVVGIFDANDKRKDEMHKMLKNILKSIEFTEG